MKSWERFSRAGERESRGLAAVILLGAWENISFFLLQGRIKPGLFQVSTRLAFAYLRSVERLPAAVRARLMFR